VRVLITGITGQLGAALLRAVPTGVDVVGTDRTSLNLAEHAQIAEVVERLAPDAIINAAAYTAVDKAESEPALAHAINADGVGALARAAQHIDARLIHVSTDFVFGNGASRPLPPEAMTAPLGIYGRTKLEGERQAMAAAPDSVIVRTAWVYADTGSNFVRTMLRLMAERPEVRVVADQIGAPTYAPGLAEALWSFTDAGVSGTFHYSDAGAASWYDFAVAIQEEALAIGLLDRVVPIWPIKTEDYPTPAQRPSYSLLDSTSTRKALGIAATHWRSNLRTMLGKIRNA